MVIMYFRENVNSPLANLPNSGNDKCRGIYVVTLLSYYRVKYMTVSEGLQKKLPLFWKKSDFGPMHSNSTILVGFFSS